MQIFLTSCDFSFTFSPVSLIQDSQMKTSIKVILVAATVGVLGMAGLAKAVLAGQNQSINAVVPQHSSMIAQKTTEIGEKSDRDRETNDDVKDSQESSKLQSLAKITPQQAQQSAEAANQGTKASQVKLENENGNLIYAVTIGQTEVTVDAGNGKVLSSSESEANEGNRPHSSIQVSQSKVGDGETK
jgi:uncharacterized membrane protein YkoI